MQFPAWKMDTIVVAPLNSPRASIGMARELLRLIYCRLPVDVDRLYGEYARRSAPGGTVIGIPRYEDWVAEGGFVSYVHETRQDSYLPGGP